jgi:hypothetical protein
MAPFNGAADDAAMLCLGNGGTYAPPEPRQAALTAAIVLLAGRQFADLVFGKLFLVLEHGH